MVSLLVTVVASDLAQLSADPNKRVENIDTGD